MMFNLNHIVKFALSLPKAKDAKKLVARAINVMDEIHVTNPTNFTSGHQLNLVFGYSQDLLNDFEKAMSTEESRIWYQEAGKRLYPESLIYSLVHDDHDDHVLLSRLIKEDLAQFTVELKRIAKEHGVFIAERVRFIP